MRHDDQMHSRALPGQDNLEVHAAAIISMPMAINAIKSPCYKWRFQLLSSNHCASKIRNSRRNQCIFSNTRKVQQLLGDGQHISAAPSTVAAY
jgi:hypothetical protein